MLKFYTRFEISDESGDPLTDRDMTLLHYSRITSLQVSLSQITQLKVVKALIKMDIVHGHRDCTSVFGKRLGKRRLRRA